MLETRVLARVWSDMWGRCLRPSANKPGLLSFLHSGQKAWPCQWPPLHVAMQGSLLPLQHPTEEEGGCCWASNIPGLKCLFHHYWASSSGSHSFSRTRLTMSTIENSMLMKGNETCRATRWPLASGLPNSPSNFHPLSGLLLFPSFENTLWSYNWQIWTAFRVLLLCTGVSLGSVSVGVKLLSALTPCSNTPTGQSSCLFLESGRFSVSPWGQTDLGV